MSDVYDRLAEALAPYGEEALAAVLEVLAQESVRPAPAPKHPLTPIPPPRPDVTVTATVEWE